VRRLQHSCFTDGGGVLQSGRDYQCNQDHRSQKSHLLYSYDIGVLLINHRIWVNDKSYTAIPKSEPGFRFIVEAKSANTGG